MFVNIHMLSCMWTTMDITLCFFISLQGMVIAQTLQFFGPTQVFKGQSVLLNCSSDTNPQESTAEFMINNETIYIIRYFKGTCFKSVGWVECTPDICRCSSNGRSFAISFNSSDSGTFRFSCSMKFYTYFDSSSYFKTKSLVVNITGKSEEHSRLVCNKSSSVEIPCNSSEDHVIVTHRVNGHFIRSFDLSSSGKSSIVLSSCNKEDIGTYECGVKAIQSAQVNDTPITVETIHLYVLGSPVISSKHFDLSEGRMILFITFYCTNEEPVISQWYRSNVILLNSTEQLQQTITSTVTTYIFGKNISLEGFTSYGFHLDVMIKIIAAILLFGLIIFSIFIAYRCGQWNVGKLSLQTASSIDHQRNIEDNLYQVSPSITNDIQISLSANVSYEGLSQNIAPHIYSEPGQRNEEFNMTKINKLRCVNSDHYEKIE